MDFCGCTDLNHFHATDMAESVADDACLDIEDASGEKRGICLFTRAEEKRMKEEAKRTVERLFYRMLASLHKR